MGVKESGRKIKDEGRTGKQVEREEKEGLEGRWDVTGRRRGVEDIRGGRLRGDVDGGASPQTSSPLAGIRDHLLGTTKRLPSHKAPCSFPSLSSKCTSSQYLMLYPEFLHTLFFYI